MPSLLSEDATSQTILTDDGRTVRVAKSLLTSPLNLGQAPQDPTLAMDASAPAPQPLVSRTSGSGPASVPSVAMGDTNALNLPEPEPKFSWGQLPVVRSFMNSELDPRNPNYKAPQAQEQAAAEPSPLPSGVDPSRVASGAPQGGGMGGGFGFGGLNRAIDAEKTAMRAGATAGIQKATEEAAYRDEQGKQLEAQEQRRQAAAADRQARMDAEIGKLQALSADVQKGAIDPNRFWNNKSAGNQLLAAIGVALGAVGGALTKTGRNPAMEMIQVQIERDIDAQRTALTQKRGAVDDQRGLLGTMMAQFGNAEQAEAATRAAMFEHAQVKVQELAAKAAGPQIQAAADQSIAQLEQKKQAAMLQFAQAAQKAVDGGGKVIPVETVTKIADLNTAENLAKKLLATWKKKSGTVGGVTQWLPGSEATEYQDERQNATQLIGYALEGGKLAEADFPRYYSMMPAPGDSLDRASAKISTLVAAIRAKRENQQKFLGSTGYDTSGLAPTVGSFKAAE